MTTKTTAYETALRKRLQYVRSEIAAGKPTSHAKQIEKLEHSYATALEHAGIDGHRDDGPAALAGRRLSAARGALQALLDTHADLVAEQHSLEQQLNAPERRAAALAEEAKCQDEAKAAQRRADNFEHVIVKNIAQHAQAESDAKDQDEMFIRNVEQGLPDDDEPKMIDGLARLNADRLAQGIPVLQAERLKHIDQRDAALRDAEGWRQVELAAAADEAQLAFEGTLATVIGPLAAYVKAHKDAHQDAPQLPDLRALAMRAETDQDDAEPPRRGLFDLLRGAH